MARGTRLPLRVTLALWMFPAIVFSFGSSVWLTQVNVSQLADSAYDRSLSGALRAIESNITTPSGGLGVELPYALFASLQATASGTVYFRVGTDDGLVQIGDVGLPEAPGLAAGEMRFFDAEYLGQRVRIGALRAQTPEGIVIEVAETTASREAFLDRIGLAAFWRDVVTTALGLGLMVAGIGAALRPLEALRRRFDRRDATDLSAVDDRAVPPEVRPLVRSFNALLSRHTTLTEAQRRFLDDASHQLRTPISVLQMQLDYALRHEPERVQTLEAMRPVIERSARTTTQMLALARADTLAARPGAGPIDAALILTEVARLHLPAARRKRLMLDLDLPETPMPLTGDETLVYEAISNLVDNAIRHAPMATTVALTLSHDATHAILRVRDEGPGMPPDRLERLGERFLSSGGNGLGLALAQAVAQAHGGRLSARNCGGLEVTLTLRRASGEISGRLKAE